MKKVQKLLIKSINKFVKMQIKIGLKKEKHANIIKRVQIYVTR